MYHLWSRHSHATPRRGARHDRAIDHVEKTDDRLGESTPTSATNSQTVFSHADTEERLVLATGQYLGEGFDDASLDTLFLTMPISRKGTLAQYVGRLHREHHAKREVVVYDYVDSGVAMLARMALKRQAATAPSGTRWRQRNHRVAAAVPLFASDDAIRAHCIRGSKFTLPLL